MFAAEIFALALLACALGALFAVAHFTRYGHLRLSEVPGFFCVLVAGRSYRARVRTILRSRARRGDAALEQAFSHDGAPVGQVESIGPIMVSAALEQSLERGHSLKGRAHCDLCHEQERQS